MRAPRLFIACSTDPSLDALEDELRAAVDVDGTLHDHASPELKRLRIEVANVRARILARLEELVQKHQDILSDSYHTLREDRYVLPVRTDAHERLPGIVHGTSASGATVFIEPRALVTLGNRLKVAQGEMEREVARILVILSDLVRERLPALQGAVYSLNQADLRHACAIFARDLSCTFPKLVDETRMRLRQARHPILLLDGVAVVPNDVEIQTGHAIVLSGPNAGGKTVALKILGLSALMVRAGLALPCAEGSECGFFTPILTDVGDDQSLAKNLSTFSAHITNLVRILEQAGPRSLVLLDELAGGTDPEEGAALACAVVDALCRRGAAVGVTTHYEPLKALALRDPRLRNASVGFDVREMRPTFTLMLDVPGASSALAVASRFGIPADVIETARRVLPDQAKSFDELVRRLEEEWSALAITRKNVEEEQRQAADIREKLAHELVALQERGKSAISKETERLVSEIKRTRDDVREARARVKQKKLDEQALEVARKVVDSAASKLAMGGEFEPVVAREAEPDPANFDPSTLHAGMRVFVPRLRSEAEILEGPTRGRVRVAAGSMKLWLGLHEVRAATKPPPESPKASREMREALPASTAIPTATADNTLDVRGLRADDALAMMDSFLDRLYGASVNVGYILHGLGTGALRDVLRAKLREPSRYVRESRPATTEEGGDRYTLVFLR
ncbi:MAG: Smr/MutS family protein [Sandaracinaceae bacterium]|nr:Smr/MutS family protein [Sandaracinaceae bacterium]